ncbi:MAG: tetratricopeptide repeat protein [Smithella sp.]
MTVHKKTLIKIFLSFSLICSILIIYWQVSSFEFVAYDDARYISLSSKKLSLDSFFWAFRSMDFANWHPLTWLSLILDYNLYNPNAGGYHITNLLFHIFNTLLLFFLLSKMTGALYRSAFVAALFALHPLHVESVAWVSERKDVLSAFFWFLTMWSYVHYIKKPDWKNYLLVFFFFVLGLMAKPMLVTLPFALLLMDYWPLGRIELAQVVPANGLNTEKKSFSFLILEKLPLFVVTFFSCIITYIAQSRYEAVVSFENISFASRILNAFNSYAGYLEKTFYIQQLGVFYPYPTNFELLKITGSVLLFLSITALVIIRIKKQPYLAVGWFWFLGTLIPVIGIIQVGSQAMADRYTYIPLIGIFIGVSWMITQRLQTIKYGKTIMILAIAFYIPIIMYSTYHQVEVWKNTLSLFEHALSFNWKNYRAYNMAGYAISQSGEYEKALYYYHMALKINPRYDSAYTNAGNVLQKMGKLDEAINCYTKALQINKKSAEAQYNLGIVLILKNRFQEAADHFKESLKINPDDADVHNNLGIALVKAGKIKEGFEHFQQSLHLNPGSLEFQKNVSVTLSMLKTSR